MPLTRWLDVRTIAGAVAGAILVGCVGLARSCIHETTLLAESLPELRITSIQLSPSRIPQLKHSADQAIALSELATEIIRQRLLVRVDDPDAIRVRDICAKSNQLRHLPADGSGHIDNLEWIQNVAHATEIVGDYQSFADTLRELHRTLRREGRPLEERQGDFRAVIAQHQQSRGAINAAVGVCHVLRSNDEVNAVRQMWETIEETRSKEVVWPYEKNQKDQTYAFPIPRGFFIIDYYPAQRAGDFHRNRTAEAIADLVARLDPDTLCPILKLAYEELDKEVGLIRRFVEASNDLLRKKLTPRVEVHVAGLNQSRTAATIAPWAAVEVFGVEGRIAGIPGTISEIREGGNGRSQGSVEALADSFAQQALSARESEYVVIQSGTMARIRWEGEFAGSPEEWDRVQAAYDAGLLKCKFLAKSFRGRNLTSETTEFGEMLSTDKLNDLLN